MKKAIVERFGGKLMTSLVFISLGGFALADPVDLRTWVPVNNATPNDGTWAAQGDANWVVAPDGSSAVQENNADPSFLLDGEVTSAYTIDGQWRVVTDLDDDPIGFVVGYQDPGHCYLFSWKQVTQDTFLAKRGFMIKKLHAPAGADLKRSDFMASQDTPNSTVLASLIGDTAPAYEDWVNYSFHLDFAPGVFHVEVTDPAGNLLWDVDVDDDTYTSGQFGFFNASQSMVEYSGFIKSVYTPSTNSYTNSTPVDLLPGRIEISKSAARSLVSIGDSVVYSVNVKETTGLSGVQNVRLIDTCPEGFVYRSGSARSNGQRIADPEISEDGRILTFSMGDFAAGDSAEISYSLLVGPGASPGLAINVAVVEVADAASGEWSDKAEYSVDVIDATRACYILGRVTYSEGTSSVDAQGLGGVRVYLEDGTYAVTDKDGKYHFEGVAPGLHVVQLDLMTLPEGARAIGKESTRFAGGGFSQFVDIQRGALWRADFPVCLKDADSSAIKKRSSHLSKEKDRTLSESDVPGTNSLRCIQPWRAEIVAEESILVADGLTAPVVSFRLTDRNGHPVMEDSEIECSVLPPNALFRSEHGEDNGIISQPLDSVRRYTVGSNGIARVKLEPTSEAGEVKLMIPAARETEELSVWLEPSPREWILVGLASGKAGRNKISDNIEAAGADGQDDIYTDTRVAFFAKGRIKGKWLLTASYDSEEDGAVQSSFDRESLDKIIDPDSYYTLYGDASKQKSEGTASSERLFVKLERERFYSMFGDYDTGLDDSILGRYSRSFTGGKAVYNGDRMGFNAFVSETEQGFMRDEIRGQGKSGIYHLSADGLMINSEKIVLETRDRYNNDVILKRQPLLRHMDYEIDYADGSLWFKSPVMSKDPDLNPVFIVVNYELTENMAEDYVYGGRAYLRPIKGLEIGVTRIYEGYDLAEGELYAADVLYKLTDRTELRAEISDSDKVDRESSTQGEAYIVELTHDGKAASGRVFIRDIDEGFGLSQQNTGLYGGRKYGLDTELRLPYSLRLSTLGTRYKSYKTNAVQDVVEAKLSWKKGCFDTSLGGLYAENDFEDDEADIAEQVVYGAGWQSRSNRFRLRADHYQSFGDKSENADYPDKTVAGISCKVASNVSLFGNVEYAEGESLETTSFNAGLQSEPWSGGKASMSLTQGITENSSRTFANLGMSQTFRINNAWSVSASADSCRTIDENMRKVDDDVPLPSGGDMDDFTALSVGVGYDREKWGASARVERQFADTEDRLGMKAGVIAEIYPCLSMGLHVFALDTDRDSGEDEFEGKVRHSVAYRPFDPRWIILNRLDVIRKSSNQDDIEDSGTQQIVDMLNVNYLPTDDFQISFSYACRHIEDSADDEASFSDVIGLEARKDLTERFDLGLRALSLNAWKEDKTLYALGPSIGCAFADNVWVSLGYNFSGFYDKDFSQNEYTSEGMYVQFRMKFDQKSLKSLKDVIARKQ